MGWRTMAADFFRLQVPCFQRYREDAGRGAADIKKTGVEEIMFAGILNSTPMSLFASTRKH
jgi:hypothetical protein|tara:strand:- start:341 stop:523 length:183 start_codon:yes stop_codon:yes gene_type:complete